MLRAIFLVMFVVWLLQMFFLILLFGNSALGNHGEFWAAGLPAGMLLMATYSLFLPQITTVGAMVACVKTRHWVLAALALLMGATALVLQVMDVEDMGWAVLGGWAGVLGIYAIALYSNKRLRSPDTLLG